jgi:hypothetical protein
MLSFGCEREREIKETEQIMINQHGYIYTLAELEAMPTLESLMHADVKVQTEHMRVILSRDKKVDGAPYDNEVTVEIKHGDSRGWAEVANYEAVNRYDVIAFESEQTAGTRLCNQITNGERARRLFNKAITKDAKKWYHVMMWENGMIVNNHYTDHKDPALQAGLDRFSEALGKTFGL